MGKKTSERKIIHIDMDCFYAAVESLDFPELCGKPMAIGGGERGVLSTANYEARAFGVKSAMPTKMALQKCPHLILRPHRFERYKEISATLRTIFLKHTNKIEPLSLDEAYLDVSKNRDYAGSATWLAKSITKEIKQTTGLTASAGIAPNKFLAKVASDWNKPDGLFTISPNEVQNFVKELPVRHIFGVGKVMQEHLKRWNIHNCGDLQQWSLESLITEFGNWGPELYNYSRGIDQREVKTNSQRKSLSVEHTFTHDQSFQECLSSIEPVYLNLKKRWEKISIENQLPIKTAFLKVKTKAFEVKSLDRSFQSLPSIDFYINLFHEIWKEEFDQLRLIGLGLRFEENDSLRAKQRDFFNI